MDRALTHEWDTLRWLALLTGARPLPADRLAALLAALPAAEWDRLLALAEGERLAPVVLAHLREQGVFTLAPRSVQAALQAEDRRNKVRYAIQVYGLGHLTAAFTGASLPFRLLKGLAVAAQAYPVPTARMVGDLDLWVRPADRDRTLALLAACGYQPRLSVYPDPFLRAYYGQQEWVTAPGSPAPAWIDLHWHLLNAWWLRGGLRVPEETLFARSVPVEIAGQSYPTLDPTDTVYYLCLHALGGLHVHPWRCFTDIALLARRQPIDWARLRALAHQSGAGVLLWRTFALMDRAFGSDFGARLGPPPAPWQRTLVPRLAPVAPPGTPPAPEDDAERILPPLALLAGPAAHGAALARLLWPTSHWLRLRYSLHGRGATLRGRLRHLLRLWPRRTMADGR